MFAVHSTRFFILSLLWLGVVMAGFGYLIDYSGRAGSPGEARGDWPAESGLAVPEEKMLLVMSAHPHCPCTRATIEELARIMARRRDSIRAQVLFWAPEGEPEWARAGLWKKAAAIPGVAVFADEGGVEARHFGLETSGHALLYSQTGRLLFTGGITPFRGHQGPSIGRTAILRISAGEKPPAVASPVFGCQLFSPGDLVKES